MAVRAPQSWLVAILLGALGCGSAEPQPLPQLPSAPCASPAVQAPIPRQLRLLTRREYDRTVAELLPQLAGGGACARDVDCDWAVESCVAGTCQADPCALVTFAWPSDGHEASVSVAGTFNGWDAGAWPMTWEPSRGVWMRKTVVPDGVHQYKFVIDGTTWVSDPAAAATADDGYGGVNAVLTQACGTDPGVAEPVFAPAAGFPPESPPAGFPFDDAAETGLVTTVHAELYGEAAASLAEAAVSDLPTLLGCPLPGSDCVEPWVRAFGRRAYRRTLTEDEVARVTALALASPELAAGVSTALQALLQSPYFLYRSETGAPQLDGAEIATAIAYFLSGGPPDEALLTAGEAGTLADPGARAAEAERLLADPRARDTLAAFAAQWLDVVDVPTLVRVDPTFDAALGAAMVAQAQQDVVSVVFDGSGRFADLLLRDTTWVNPDIAALYGLPPPADGGWAEVEAPAGRPGLVGLPGVLTHTSHSDQTSPIRRGLFVRERVLCQPLPAPPPNVGPVPTVSADASTRDRFAQHTADPFCASCHQAIDPVGFALEGFDPIGRARAEDGGAPVDTTGTLSDLPSAGADVPLDGATDLAEALAAAPEARRCYVAQTWRFAAGRLETPAQQCAIDALDARFAGTGGDVRDLLVALVASDDFVRRSP